METVEGMRILTARTPPPGLERYRQRAGLAEDFSTGGGDGYSFVAVADSDDWPQLAITQRFSPAVPGFASGVLLVPERGQVFIGAGTRLLAYRRRAGRWGRSWIDEADVGFWEWRRHGDVVLMAAELELAAWTTGGEKVWTTFVEPPWSYQVKRGRVELDVMGSVRTFGLVSGPGLRETERT